MSGDDSAGRPSVFAARGGGSSIPWIDAETLARVMTWTQVIDVLESALRRGAAPGNTPARTFVPVGEGELIVMPGEVGGDVGVKVLSAHDRAGELGVPRIQGVHIAFDGTSLTPVALLDAEALTILRTSGVSALAVRHLAPPAAGSLLVFGTGPQSTGHALAINAVRPLSQVVVVGRRTPAVDAVVADLRASGLAARAGSADDVAHVDIVACCTTTAEPLFDSSLLRAGSTVVAIGSHSPTMREVDTDLVRRATVVVETRESALSQAGDIILAIADGVAEQDAIDGDLLQLIRGQVRVDESRARLFKSVGEAWTDVVVAGAAVRATSRG